MTGALRPRALLVVLPAGLLLGSCAVVPPEVPRPVEALPPPPVAVAPAPTPTPPAVPTFSGPATFTYDGQLTQGGWIRGQVPGGTVSALLGDQALAIAPDGSFFAAFDRDAGPSAQLVAVMADGREVISSFPILPRAWQIERVNVARRPGGSTAAFMELRRPELARINAARVADAPSEGWRQRFIWPAPGRISGRFGSQRIYRGGEEGAYHSGLDIAGGGGTVYVAPADGVVTLAATTPFSLEGYLLIIDHGQGLNSAFLHSSELLVREGDVVRQGQPLGRIGATGRATGPHLHWSIKWRDARLDPLLFLPARS
ncbi:M23 family metallopeptidase [Alteraurantiacibacter buctensis]|uniref:M23 family metallopeptidase n=1 Tax=Alteraurantiacibacter buctensis TaxID=1503981 RepID=UPI003F6A7641